MNPISLQLLRAQKHDKQHLLDLIDHAQNVIDQAVRFAIADESIRPECAWLLDSALTGVEQACRVTRSRITSDRFGREAA